jgi:ABC-type spermidine/putrescine transport system permease subunit I
MTLCKYKNIFGKPREGIHNIRVFDIAIIDVLLTIVVGFLLTKAINKRREDFMKNFALVLIILFCLAIIIHRVFCVDTKINTLIFGRLV